MPDRRVIPSDETISGIRREMAEAERTKAWDRVVVEVWEAIGNGGNAQEFDREDAMTMSERTDRIDKAIEKPYVHKGRQLCALHPSVDYRVAWGCPDCLKELREELRQLREVVFAAWTVIHDAVDLTPAHPLWVNQALDILENATRSEGPAQEQQP